MRRTYRSKTALNRLEYHQTYLAVVRLLLLIPLLLLPLLATIGGFFPPGEHTRGEGGELGEGLVLPVFVDLWGGGGLCIDV